MDWPTAVVTLAGGGITLAGVFIGGWLTHRAGEETWVRDARISQYSKLLNHFDRTTDALDAIMVAMGSPADFPSEEEWHASWEERWTAFNKETDELRWAVSEASLFASRAVSTSALQMLEGLSQLITAFVGDEQAPEVVDEQRV